MRESRKSARTLKNKFNFSMSQALSSSAGGGRKVFGTKKFSIVEFDKKKMVRTLDEWEHKHACMIERRNRLMKELNHLKEVN